MQFGHMKLVTRAFLLLVGLCGAVQAVSGSPPAGNETTRNVWGEIVEKPRYGGTVTLAITVDYQHTDPWFNWNGTYTASPVLEKLGIGDWSIPRSRYAFNSGFVPIDVIKPHLAESWEMPDPKTIIFRIRKGIHWQDKSPVNGREFDAYDVAMSLRRVMGTGEFEALGPSPYAHMVKSAMLESAEATDKWTVVVKVRQPSLLSLSAIYWQSWEGAWIAPREVIQQYGDHRDWRHLVGTGPFILTDHVEGTSWTYRRNPDYWYKDERFPGMELPFIDELRVVVIPDRASQIAALRSGKIDVLTGLTIEEARAIKRSNPEILIHYSPGGGVNRDSTMQVSRPPFNDLRVRKAMQKAINLKEIARYYYFGQATSEPYGLGGPTVVEQGFDAGPHDWPEEVREGYRYDPRAARQLLTEAGYPDGFKFTYDAIPGADIDLMQLYKHYWAQIGVEAEINVLSSAAAGYNQAYKGDFDMTVIGMRANNYTPLGRLRSFMSGETENFGQWSDPEYDRLAEIAYAATDMDDFNAAVGRASTYYASQHITLANAYPDSIVAVQPWIKGGYWGQIATGGGGMIFTIWSRFWVDQTMKE
ncbi:MAG: ABC transporter substrate-binding protein [Proteobacteria bacterium]|jgi:peptide/nickel transport system substrate-binding protein|nr:ABC transporter substrate-binding protein [Pseudomonadota bacterium]